VLLASQYGGKTYCVAVILYEHSFEGFVTSWAKDFETPLVRKHNIFIFAFCLALKLSFRIFPLLVIFYMALLIQDIILQNFGDIFSWCVLYISIANDHTLSYKTFQTHTELLIMKHNVMHHIPTLTWCNTGWSGLILACVCLPVLGKVIKDTLCIICKEYRFGFTVCV
jgi:hypothetical protein